MLEKVVMRFGKVQDTVFDEGIHPIMPRHRLKDSTFAFKTALMQMLLLKIYKKSTELAINWHIDPARVNKVFNKLGMKSKSLVELSLRCL